jgi:phosphohistidine phosphatase
MTTANYFAAAYNKKEQDIIQIDKLYHAEIDTFFEVITAIDNVFNTVAIFSHNPGITDFIRLLTPVRIVSMPPCGVYALKINTDDWTNFKTANKEFLFFDYPKEF